MIRLAGLPAARPPGVGPPTLTGPTPQSTVRSGAWPLRTTSCRPRSSRLPAYRLQVLLPLRLPRRLQQPLRPRGRSARSRPGPPRGLHSPAFRSYTVSRAYIPPSVPGLL